MTLQALAGMEGILYANSVDGATTILDFLEFLGEASNNFLPNGEGASPSLWRPYPARQPCDPSQ